MSAIADLVSLLLSTGIPPETVSSIVELAHKHALEQVDIHRNSGGIPPESAAERRKAWDRERKRKNAETKKAPLILSSLLVSSEDSSKEEGKKDTRARAKKRLGSLPENWQPPLIAGKIAAECGTTVQHVEAIFRDYLKSSGKLYADHDAAFCNFVRNQQKFNGAKPNGKTHDQHALGGFSGLAEQLRRKIAEDDAREASAGAELFNRR